MNVLSVFLYTHKYIAYFERHNHVDVPLEFQEDDKNKYNGSINSRHTHIRGRGRTHIDSPNGTGFERTNVGV